MNENLDPEDTTAYDKHLMGNIQRVPIEVFMAHYSNLMLTDGKQLLDYWGDEGVCSLGYNSAEYRDAAMEFLRMGAPHQLPDVYPHPLRWRCAEMLCARSGMDKVFFANSGTEANEAAIKLARKYWWDRDLEESEDSDRPTPITDGQIHDRHVILTVEGNFHGRTGLSMAASDPRVSPYHRWGFGPTAQGFGVIRFRDTVNAGNWRLVVEDGYKVDGGCPVPEWDRVAAVILAPVLGNNTVHTYPESFWRALRKLREENGCLLIYDDVQAGMGRAGSLATWTQYGVRPDIMTLGKGIAMGHPMSAMLATEEVARAFTPGVHFNTFGGSPFACHMAIRMMEWLDHHQSVVNKKGEWIRAEFKARDWIKEHDGAGMLNAFTPNFGQFGYTGYDFCRECRGRGLSLMTHRPYGPIRFTPPLNVGVEELKIAFRIIDEVQAALEK